MSSAKSNTDGTLYSICVFEDRQDHMMNNNTSHPMSMSVEEYEAYVDNIIDCESQNANDSVDDMGNHLINKISISLFYYYMKYLSMIDVIKMILI